MIVNRTEEEKSKEYDFSGDDRKKEAYWKRDKNLRGVLMHLYEWHQLLLNWLKNRFEISAQSFYQVNPVQTKKLYQTAIGFANLTGEETAIDAYCGIGTISLSLAEKCRAVYGVEIVEAAIEDAKRNAELNELDNLRFEVGNAEDWMAKWKEKGIRPNVIMVDPPRKGLTESLIESATGMNPDRIVYVSYNPATLVRDIQSLMEKGYHVEGRIQPVDQFPQTAHVETVCLLSKLPLS